MASHSCIFSLLLMILFTLIITTITFATTPPTTPHNPIIKPNSPSYQQISNIIEALIVTGDFSNWAEVLSTTDPSTFPLTATFFIPSDNVLSNFTSTQFLQFDPSTFAYHIVPQQLHFSLLKTFKICSRIPTLLPNKTILVTNNTESNYTIDDSQITHPDLYINGAISVHGIGYLLNYSVFGGGGGFLEDHQISKPGSPPPNHSAELPEDDDDHHKNGHDMDLDRSTGSCLSVKNCILIVVSIIMVVLIPYVKVFLWKVVLVLLILVIFYG